VFRLRGGVGLLGESAELFDACLLASDDVSVVAFVRACHHFISVLALFGKYAKVLIGATEENLRIVEGATGDDSGASSLPSARAFLAWDKSRGKHLPGGVLAKDSPAEALLWLRRGISLYLGTFERHLESPSSFREEARHGYREQVLPYNGWIMQKAAGANFMLAPTWDWVVQHGKLTMSAAQLDADLKAWVAVVKEVLARLAALHKSLDLEDVRKA